MTDLVRDLGTCMDEIISVQRRLLDAVHDQRIAIASGDRVRIQEVATAMEVDVLRLGALESRRNTIASALADTLGCVATRWSAIRERLGEADRSSLGSRVGEIERLVRELELGNAVNGELVRTELDLVDMSIRSLATTPQQCTRAYAAGGRPQPQPVQAPALLNLSA